MRCFFQSSQNMSSTDSVTWSRSEVRILNTETQKYDENTKNLMQHQIELFNHSTSCRRNDSEKITKNDNNDDNVNRNCNVMFCDVMKNAINHIAACEMGDKCNEPNCTSVQKSLGHWFSCVDARCTICLPLRYNGSYPYDDDCQQRRDVSSSDDAGDRAKREINGDNWRAEIRSDLREFLAQKVVEAIVSVPVMGDIMNSIVDYAVRVEDDIYKRANSRSDYYYLLAKKIYEIQTELEKKRRYRQEQKKLQSVTTT